MGIFQWLMKKITKAFGRGTNALFYTLLYREILNEVYEITKDEEESLKILRDIGGKAALESCERHSSIFKFMPGSPDKVLDYFAILWSVVFGMEIGETEHEEIPNPGHIYNDYILTVKQCPICASYGNDPEDRFDFSKTSSDAEGMACGLCGMLENVANFILKTKENNYRIRIIERQCIAKGGDALKFECKIYDLEEWQQFVDNREVELQDAVSKESDGFLDMLQKYISLDKLEELLDEPLDQLKHRTADFIREKMNMAPEHFFDYFRNYEEDMIRILGFFAIHLMNEYGSLLEKLHSNEVLAKVSGYIFKHVSEMTHLFIPSEILDDYHELLVRFLDGLAPVEMVDRMKEFSGKDDIKFLFEGAQIALENLGINFSELKENIWEELNKEREDGLISSDPSMTERSREKFPKIIQIIQEIMMLVNEILTLPVRVILSQAHHGVKTAINSVVSEEEGLFGSIKDRTDRIIDQFQELRS